MNSNIFECIGVDGIVKRKMNRHRGGNSGRFVVFQRPEKKPPTRKTKYS